MIFTILFLLIALQACKNEDVSAGRAALLSGEEVIVKSDTISSITSELKMADAITTTPDSFLLGECKLKHFGTLKADILTQFACPVGFAYPDSSEVDSVCLYLYFRSYVGDGTSPLGISVYEMDGEGLSYSAIYQSDIDVAPYCSRSNSVLLARDYILRAGDTRDSVYVEKMSDYYYGLRIPLSQAFRDKLFAIRDYSSQEAFSQLFKGLYITTTYGSNTCLYVIDMSIGIHYHYTYPTDASGSQFKVQHDTKYLYANSEVRQVNRYEYPEREHYETVLRMDTDANYIVSPACYYTTIKIPMKDIASRILDGVDGSRPYINMAELRIDILNATSQNKANDDWAGPSLDMLLVTKSAYKDFIEDDDVELSDTCAMYGEVKYETDTLTSDYNFYYTFSLNAMLTEYMRHAASMPDTLELVLMPVDIVSVASTNTSTVVGVHQKQSVTVTQIRSATAKEKQMDIEIVYSGFSDVQL